MGLDQRQVAELHAGAGKAAAPGLAAALEFQDVALRHRQEILDVLGGAEHHRLVHFQRGLDIGEHHSGGTVGHERAIGALERPGHIGVFLALGAAELVAEVFSHLRERIADPVLVVLGRDPGQRVGLVAVFLEIGSRDLAEDAGKAALDIGLLADIGGLEQVPADFGRGRRGHLLDADDEHQARRIGLDRPDRLMHRGRAGGAGVLDPGRALEAQLGGGLEHQRGGEILGREAAIEMAQHDFVDVLRLDPGVGERLLGDPHDQALDRFAFELAERRVGPANDAGGHDGLLGRASPKFRRFPGRWRPMRRRIAAALRSIRAFA